MLRAVDGQSSRASTASPTPSDSSDSSGYSTDGAETISAASPVGAGGSAAAWDAPASGSAGPPPTPLRHSPTVLHEVMADHDATLAWLAAIEADAASPSVSAADAEQRTLAARVARFGARGSVGFGFGGEEVGGAKPVAAAHSLVGLVWQY